MPNEIHPIRVLIFDMRGYAGGRTWQLARDEAVTRRPYDGLPRYRFIGNLRAEPNGTIPFNDEECGYVEMDLPINLVEVDVVRRLIMDAWAWKYAAPEFLDGVHVDDVAQFTKVTVIDFADAHLIRRQGETDGQYASRKSRRAWPVRRPGEVVAIKGAYGRVEHVDIRIEGFDVEGEGLFDGVLLVTGFVGDGVLRFKPVPWHLQVGRPSTNNDFTGSAMLALPRLITLDAPPRFRAVIGKHPAIVEEEPRVAVAKSRQLGSSERMKATLKNTVR